MKKIAIIGCGGSGKSVLAAQLGIRLGLPVYHLDRLFWRPGWVKIPREEWIALQEKLCAQNTWIMDGNYGGTMDLRLGACDSVIFLDFPRVTCLWGAVKRRIQFNGRTRPDVCEGCPEKLDWEYLQWIWNYRKEKRPGILSQLDGLKGRKRVVILKSRREVGQFLEEGSLKTNGSAVRTGRQNRKGDNSMQQIETKRLILRSFTHEDWSDVHELAIDWSKAPGPAFDKWPTSEDGAKGLTDHFTKNANCFAVSLRAPKKVIGMIGLNGIDEKKQLDLGHVILSKYQDNDVDLEAIKATVSHVFAGMDVRSIITMTSEDPKQLAPLKSLGFINRNPKNVGELMLSKEEWTELRNR